MKRDVFNYAILQSIKYGVVASILLTAAIGVFITLGINTVWAQFPAKFIIVGGAVLLGFRKMNKDHGKKFRLFPAVFEAICIGIVTAVIATGFEIISFQLFHVLLQPYEFQTMNAPQYVLSIMFSVEMIAFSLITALVVIQAFKKPHFISKKSEDAGHSHSYSS